MIKRRNTNTGMNANVSLEPNAAASSNNKFTSNIYVQTPYPTEIKTQPSTFDRDIELDDIDKASEQPLKADVRVLILETYANILLNQDKALISNLVSKHTIIIPKDDLADIIKAVTGGEVEICTDDASGCCAARVSPIQRIDDIKIITDSGEIVTDFKQVYNKEYNELVNVYHLNLKHVVV